ncbi:MAG: FAD-dependent oxidoreductase [Acidimicrobiaceae bacterium]|nr:FAD-dependent oxidoreductase [Acidimicrobiaceae bacterium]
MANWDHTFDFVIVGSGGGGLVAAMVAVDQGLRPIVLEKQALLGGSTAMSGGVIWMPDNPLMKAEGVRDSHADGLAYLQDVVGDGGPGSSPERREVFLTEGSRMISYLQGKGVELVRCPGYSDYYDDHKGGNAEGRSVEAAPFDAVALGPWRDKIQPGLTRGIGMAVKTNEMRSISYYNRAPSAFKVAARAWLRTTAASLRKQDLLTNGASLVAQMVRTLLADEVPIWTNTAVTELVVEDGKVTGVIAQKDGTQVRMKANRGVLLAAGGFARSPELRRKYSGSQPNEAQWTMANPGDTGEVLEQAIRLGAATDLLDEAWWLPSPAPGLGSSTLGAARQRPGAIFVNHAGKRFCNESNSYVEVGKAMYAHDGVPCWLIFDDGFRRRYAAAKSLPGRLPQEWIDKGLVRRADTLEELARQIDLDTDALAETVRRFNLHAAQGLDPDFGRGRSAYNRCLGDPGYKPNAALGPLDRSPFYAAEIYPADVGTCGGLVTDQHARVLDAAGSPLAGLYATGNITATVMGRTYPGAGASIANTMVFGYVAAHHVAGAPG